MVRSLLVKLGILAVTAVLVVWIGWPQQQDDPVPPPVPPSAAPPGGEVQALARQEASPRPSALLDLNRATAEDLQRLPGIGAVLARRVVEWRTTHGPFRTVEELNSVKGIGPKKLERIRALVTVGPQAPGLKGSRRASREGA